MILVIDRPEMNFFNLRIEEGGISTNATLRNAMKDWPETANY